MERTNREAQFFRGHLSVVLSFVFLLHKLPHWFTHTFSTMVKTLFHGLQIIYSSGSKKETEMKLNIPHELTMLRFCLEIYARHLVLSPLFWMHFSAHSQREHETSSP